MEGLLLCMRAVQSRLCILSCCRRAGYMMALRGTVASDCTLSSTLLQDDRDGVFVKWRVENSWGEDHGHKGYLCMTDEWFSEYVYEVVVDRKHVPEEVLAVLEQEPIVLPAWDPMGALAE